jgi:8-oxo-dGTP diphosphatase
LVIAGKRYLDFEFLAAVAPGEPRVRERHRVEDWRWYPMDALPSPLFEPDKLAIAAYVMQHQVNRSGHLGQSLGSELMAMPGAQWA